MGNVCCGEKKKKKKIVLLLVGLDNAGKTVAAKGLAGESIDDVVPTVGFHTVKLGYKDFIVNVYDLGGAASFRGIWPKYFVDAYGLIFVIDSSDFERLDEAKRVLESVLSHEKISGKPLLFLANKQDSENALDEIDLHEKLNLENLVNTYHCPTLVECCSATDKTPKGKIDHGIKKGFSWLMSYISTNFDNLHSRVAADIILQEQIENRLRNEIIMRIQHAKKVEKKEDEDAIELYSEYARKINLDRENNYNNGNCVKHSDSVDEFEPVYFGSIQNHNIERPKSAREFVKDQLRLNCYSSSVLKGNRTIPIHLIGAKLSHSAKERSQRSIISSRTLKSAGDIHTSSVHLPNMVFPQGNDNFDLKKFSKTSHFLPLDVSANVKIQNGISWCKSKDDNGLSIIEIS